MQSEVTRLVRYTLITLACMFGLSSTSLAESGVRVGGADEAPSSTAFGDPIGRPLLRSTWQLDRAPAAGERTEVLWAPSAVGALSVSGDEFGVPMFPLGCGSTIPWASVATANGFTVLVSNNCLAFLTDDEVTHLGAFAREQGAFFDLPPPYIANPGIPWGVQTLFDPHAQRFIIAGAHEPPFRKYVAVAMSQTSDPNGHWYKHVFIDVPKGTIGRPSLPVVGVDADYVYVSIDFLFANDPTDPFSKTLIYIFDKNDLAQDLHPETPPHMVVEPFPALPVRPFPVLNHDVGAPAQYFVTPFGTPVGTSRLRLFAITGLPDSSTVDTIEIDVPPHVLNSSQQMPTPGNFTIRAESSRIRSAVYRDGSLWTAMHLHPEGGDRRLVRWYEIAMNGWPTSGQAPTLVQHGDVDPRSDLHTHEPAVAVNARGQMTVVFGQTSESHWPSIGHAWREPRDPPGSLRIGGILGETMPFESLFASRSWGAQSSVANDPVNPLRFLSAAMVRGLAGNEGNAGTTWLARFNLPELTPTLGIDPSILDFGDVVLTSTSALRTATLQNTGSDTATGLTFGSPEGDFDVNATDCGTALAAGESCEITATFTPAALGPANTSVMVESAEGASTELSLAGNGVSDTAVFSPIGLEVDPFVVSSDGNGILEPGEFVTVAPTWRNDGIHAQDLSGSVSGLNGPGGAVYTIESDSASYGAVETGATASCLDTGDCYVVGVNNPALRPATHWMVTLDESVSDGTEQSWTLHIGASFSDVPRVSPFYRFIETILHHGVTGGCTATEYCPGGVSSRAQMPVFVLRAMEGAAYAPPACVEGEEAFFDVPFTDPFCPWIEELFYRGVVSGCGGGDYCPGSPVTRAQMAVFLLKTLEGDGYTPAACSGIFADVVCPSPFADWIEELYERGITGGCGEDPLEYCPADTITRAQMAAFLTEVFELTLYGP